MFSTKGKIITLVKKFDESDQESINSQWSDKRNGDPNDSNTDDVDDAKKLSNSRNRLTPSPDQSFGKKTTQYNSFRLMKQKVFNFSNSLY